MMRQKGSVKWWSRLKGYGFIQPDDGGPEVFAHYSEIVSEDKYKNLYEGEGVSFEVVSTDKGPKATLISGDGGVL